MVTRIPREREGIGVGWGTFGYMSMGLHDVREF